MNKKLVLLGMAALSVGASAMTNNSFRKIELPSTGVQMYQMSRDGRFVFGYENPTPNAYVFDTQSEKLYNIVAPSGSITVDAVSNNGVLAGCVSPADDIWQMDAYIFDTANNAVKLSSPAGSNGTIARAISADASVVAGILSYPDMRVPILWTKQGDGTYAYTTLPYPTLDYSNRKPQAIDIIDMSADGTVLAARLVAYNGLVYMPLIYSKNNAGVWNYRILGRDLLVKPDAVIPTSPGPEVNCPVVSDYATTADLASWNTAKAAYQDSLTLLELGMISTVYYDPTDRLVDFLTTNSAAYWTAYNKYITYSAAYAGVYTVDENGNSICVQMGYLDSINAMGTGLSFSETFTLSGNGRYLLATQKKESLETMLDQNVVECAPAYFDLQNDGAYYAMPRITDAIAVSISDEGDVFYAAPYLEYTRISYVKPRNVDYGVELTRWTKACFGYNLGENLQYSWSYTTVDENGFTVPVNVIDSVLTGTVGCSADGRTLAGFFQTNTSPFPYENWTARLGERVQEWSSVPTIDATDAIAIYPNPTAEKLHFTSEVSQVSVLDLTGRVLISQPQSVSELDVNVLQNGNYLVRFVANGQPVTRPFIVIK